MALTFNSCSISSEVKSSLWSLEIIPILLYGSEVWAFESCEMVDVFQRKFFKQQLKLKKATPSCIVYGETGQMKVSLLAESRMLTFGQKSLLLLWSLTNSQISCIDLWLNYTLKTEWSSSGVPGSRCFWRGLDLVSFGIILDTSTSRFIGSTSHKITNFWRSQTKLAGEGLG